MKYIGFKHQRENKQNSNNNFSLGTKLCLTNGAFFSDTIF
jgi:hypothetical protein